MGSFISNNLIAGVRPKSPDFAFSNMKIERYLFNKTVP